MANFAVMEGNNVVDAIIADSLAIAETNTGKTCIEFTDEAPAYVGGTYNVAKKKFLRPQPFPSWILDRDDNWNSPVAYPWVEGKNFTWNEDNQAWDEVTE